MAWSLFIAELRRRVALMSAAPGVLRDYLATPFPGSGSAVSELEFLSLDLETTGLDPRRDRIVSLGVVPVRGLAIDLSGAWQAVVHSEGELPERSVTIHGITHDRVAGGEPLPAVMDRLLSELAGKVLLAHHARIERGFLDVACRRLYGRPLVMPVVDTQYLAARRLQRAHQPVVEGGLRLSNLRRQYHLPRYQAHNALSDALACAELFLAQVAEMAPDGAVRLKYLL